MGDPALETDWLEWHRPYDDPASALSQRLAVVQRDVRAWLDAAPPGPLAVVSLCAGQGRDIIEVLASHPRRDDVSARLVEADPRNVARAAAAAERCGLHRVDAVLGDASLASSYAGAVPAGLVLLCGVLGNISDADAEATISALPMLCDEGSTVIWTRHRRPPDRTPALRAAFGRHGFAEVDFTAPPEHVFTVGVHVLEGAPAPLDPAHRLFHFVGDGWRPA